MTEGRRLRKARGERFQVGECVGKARQKCASFKLGFRDRGGIPVNACTYTSQRAEPFSPESLEVAWDSAVALLEDRDMDVDELLRMAGHRIDAARSPVPFLSGDDVAERMMAL